MKSRIVTSNTLFVIVGAAILLFLFSAPEESTSFLPHDDLHRPFYGMESKKEAEKFCLDCHDQDKEVPLPAGHPPKYRCLFCHKRL